MQHLIKRLVKIQVQIYNRDFTFAFFDSVIERRVSFLSLKHYMMEEPRFYHRLVPRGGPLFCLRFLHYHPGGSYTAIPFCYFWIAWGAFASMIATHLQLVFPPTIEVGHPSSSLCRGRGPLPFWHHAIYSSMDPSLPESNLSIACTHLPRTEPLLWTSLPLAPD